MNLKTKNENFVKIIQRRKIVQTSERTKNMPSVKGHKKDAYFEEEQDCCMVYFFTAVFVANVLPRNR